MPAHCWPAESLPLRGVVFAQPFNPPARVVPLGLRILLRRLQQGIAFAQEAAQAGVQKAAWARVALSVLAASTAWLTRVKGS